MKQSKDHYPVFTSKSSGILTLSDPDADNEHDLATRIEPAKGNDEVGVFWILVFRAGLTSGIPVARGSLLEDWRVRGFFGAFSIFSCTGRFS